jgi:protein subunit release factor B
MPTTDQDAALAARMEALGVREEDLLEKFVLGTGAGGQKINKTSSCVYLKHLPSGIEVKCQAGRSRALNRFLARRELCDRLDEIRLGRESERRQAIEKVRRQKRRRSRRSKQQSIADKRQLSHKKSLRRRPAAGDD